MGSINAIVFSCGSVALYLTGVDVQRWLAGSPLRKEAEQTSPPSFALLPNCLPPPLLIGRLAQTGWKITPAKRRSNLFFPPFLQNDRVPISSREEEEGWGPRMRAPVGNPANRSEHQLAGKLTTNTYAPEMILRLE